MGAIFISYRRDDTPGFALTLYKELGRCFSASEVFYDQEDRHHIRYGDDWFEKIRAALGTAKVFLAVIGPGWLHAADEKGNHRLWQESDVVRWEIEEALKRKENGELKIIPILINGADFPKNLAELPPSLVNLTKPQACPLSCNTADFDNHFEKLLECITSVPGIPRPLTTAKQSRIFHTIDHNLTQYFSDPADNLPLIYQTLHETEKVTVTASAATVALHGMGGVGKTQLALKYSEDFKNEYAGIWWFRAEDLGRLQQDCQQFCERCGVQVYTGEEHHHAVKRWLQEQPRWLLVYDNAEAKYGDNEDKLHPYLPRGDHHILITSRGNYWEGLAKPIALDAWSEEQALVFLLKRLEKTADDEKLRQLSRALGGLPLALEQACAYINKKKVSVSTYCKELEDWKQEEKLLNSTDSVATNYTYSVFATLSLAFDGLSNEAKELLRLCACCAPEPIPEMLFLTSTAILPEALRNASEDKLGWRETVAVLADLSLVQQVVINLTPQGETTIIGGRALLLHRLTQAAIAHRFCDLAKDWRNVAGLLRKVYPFYVNLPGNWPIARALSFHVLRLEEQIESGKLDVVVDENGHPIFWLINQVGAYLHHVAEYPQAIAILRRNGKRMEKALGVYHPDTLSGMNYLSEAFKAMGDYQAAMDLEELTLNYRKEIPDANFHDTLTSMNNKAHTFYENGDYQKAKSLQEEVLEIIMNRSDFGLDHGDTLTSINNLANTLNDMGDHKAAKELHEYVLERTKNAASPNHPYILIRIRSMMNLALTLGSMGHLQNAKKLQEEALEIATDFLGQYHSVTLTCMDNLADTLFRMGDHQKAIELLDQVLLYRSETDGPKHPETADTALRLLISLRIIGDSTVAQTVCDEYLNWLLVDGVELNDYHQQTRDVLRCVMENDGLKFENLNGIQTTIELQEQMPEPKKAGLYTDELSTMATIIILASKIVQSKGDYQAAKPLQEHVLGRLKDLLISDYPDTLGDIANLAGILWNKGKHQETKALQEQVLEVIKDVRGADHPDTLTCMANLATTYWHLGDRQEAKLLEEYVLEHRIKVLDPDHPDILVSMNNLADTRWSMGDHLGARAIFEQVLERRIELSGPDDPDTTRAAWNLFTAFREMGDLDAAQSVIDKHLVWLLADSVELRSDEEQQIQNMLRTTIGAGKRKISVNDVLQQAVFRMDEEEWAAAEKILTPLLALVNEHFDEKDPNLTAVAWHLFICLDRMGNREAKLGVLDTHLRWLITHPENELHAVQKQISHKLVGMVGETEST